ncbi:hypothetical protein IKQ21_07070 [bacterium]|nr:hypothetical protein [bacterium]
MGTNKKYLILGLIFVLLGGILGTLFVYKVSWDFLSYHYYNGWALFHNRLGTDIYPSLFRSYVNPVMDGLLYILIRTFNNHPFIFSFISGIKLGIFMFVSYLIFDFLVIKEGAERKITLFTLLLLTLLSPLIILSVEFSANDIQINTLALLGFFLFIKFFDKSDSPKRKIILFSSGILFGMAVGFKYAATVFYFGLLCCFLYNRKRIENPLSTFFIISAGIFAGFITANGWWMYTLWKNFANPIFPYFNNIFHSPLSDTNTIFGFEFAHLRPHNIIHFVFSPLRNPMAKFIGLEGEWFDLKLPLMFLSVALYPIIKKLSYIKENAAPLVDWNKFITVIIFTVSVYYTNLALFGNNRYILSVLPLAALGIVYVCNMLSEKLCEKSSLFCFFLAYLFIYHFVFIENFGIFATIARAAIICSIIIVTLCLLNKMKFRSDLSKNYIITTQLILILCILTMKLPISAYNISDMAKKVVNFEKSGIRDNSLVLCGTMHTSSIIPVQTAKNVVYTGFVLPPDLAKKGYYNKKTKFRNMYFSDNIHEKRLEKLIEKNNDVYFVYSKSLLGENEQDFELYEKAIAQYSKNKINGIKNCKIIKHKVLNQVNPWDNIVVCKIK